MIEVTAPALAGHPFLRGMPPILARRIKWYRDKDFKGRAVGAQAVLWCGLLAAGALLVWALIGG